MLCSHSCLQPIFSHCYCLRGERICSLPPHASSRPAPRRRSQPLNQSEGHFFGNLEWSHLIFQLSGHRYFRPPRGSLALSILLAPLFKELGRVSPGTGLEEPLNNTAVFFFLPTKDQLVPQSSMNLLVLSELRARPLLPMRPYPSRSGKTLPSFVI